MELVLHSPFPPPDSRARVRDALGVRPSGSQLARVLATLFALVAFGGCPRHAPESTLPLVTSDDPSAEAAIDEAREAYARGEADEAETLYGSFLAEHAEDPLSVIARLELGRLRLADGDLAAAAAHFEAVAAHEDAAVAERGRFYGAVTAHLAGDHQRAVDELAPLVGRTVAPEETALLLETLAAAAAALGDLPAAVGYRDLLVGAPVSEEERQDARRSIREIVSSRLDPAALAQLRGSLDREGFAWPLVAKRALALAFARGALAEVLAIGTELEEAGVALDDELRAMVLRAERTGRANPHAIGALLPLSGRGREVGQRALQAIMLGAGLPLAGPPHEDTPQVPFRDSGTSVADTVRAVDDLVTLHQVIAIIGPIDGERARAAASRAAELGVPLISLSPDPSVTRRGERVFRVFMAPEDEARALVSEAQRRGAHRVGAFLPEGGYGDQMTAALQAAATAAGLEVAPAERYPTDASDLRPALERLRRKRFDALLLGDSSRNLSVVAPALTATGFESLQEGASSRSERRGVHLLVTSVGARPDLVRNAGRYLQGAVFSLPFDPTSASGVGRAFADTFAARYGGPPDAFAAAAYDAYAIVRAQVDGGTQSRDALGDALGRGLETETAGPSGGLGDDRGPRHGTRLFTLRDATLAPIATE